MKNGIVIDGVKHSLVKDDINKLEDECENCSLLHLCSYNYGLLCDLFGKGGNHHFETEN